jgi:hypothetical protein
MRHLVLIMIAAACALPAAAAGPVRVVDAEQKAQCRFIKFVKTTAPAGTDAAAAALSAALDKAAGYGANAYYVMNTIDNGAKGATVDGQALACP